MRRRLELIVGLCPVPGQQIAVAFLRQASAKLDMQKKNSNKESGLKEFEFTVALGKETSRVIKKNTVKTFRLLKLG